MPIFHKNHQNLQSAKTDKSQQILQDKTTENRSIFCQNLENAVEPKTKKSVFFATKKSTPINKKHQQKNLTLTQAQTQQAPRKKFLKIFAAASLALITCATTLLATAPFCTGPASAAAETNQKNTTQTTTNSGLITPQEDDPVLFKTESGLEIKFSAGTLDGGALDGYAYVSMGKYNGEWIHWIIIGYGGTTTVQSKAISQNMANWYNNHDGNSFMNYLLNTTGPAGIAISSETDKASLVRSILATATNAQPNTTELAQGEFLVYAKDNLGSVQFYYSSNTASIRYGNSSQILAKMRSLYYPSSNYNDAGFTNDEASLIVPKKLTTYGSPELAQEYIYPLGTKSYSASDSFAIENYLTTAAVRVASADYWLRSFDGSKTSNPYWGFGGTAAGAVANRYLTDTYGFRPAMVLKLA